MKTLNFIPVFLILVFVSNVSISSAKSDNQKTTETAQNESTKTEMITEARTPTTEANASVAPENVDKGKKLFKEKNCVVCHQLNTKLIGPSLINVSKAYAGKKEKLDSFLIGKSKSIIDPAQHALMEPQIAITKAMSKEGRMAIVEYLLSVK